MDAYPMMIHKIQYYLKYGLLLLGILLTTLAALERKKQQRSTRVSIKQRRKTFRQLLLGLSCCLLAFSWKVPPLAENTMPQPSILHDKHDAVPIPSAIPEPNMATDQVKPSTQIPAVKPGNVLSTQPAPHSKDSPTQIAPLTEDDRSDHPWLKWLLDW